MFDQDRWQEIFQSIRQHRLRALLTAFGVFWGIFMLAILMGAGSGLENAVFVNFDIAKNAVFVWTQRTSVPYQGLQPGRNIQLKNSDMDALREQIPELAVISPIVQVPGSFTIEYGDESASFPVNGDYPEFLSVKPLIIEQGRFINANDILDKRKVAVIGLRVQEVLFKNGADPLGQYIEIKGVPFRVVGTFRSRVRGEEGTQDLQTIHIPATAAQLAFNRSGEIDYFACIPKPGVPAAVVETKVAALLKQRHTIAPEDERALGTANVEKEYKEVQGLFIGIRGFSWLVAIGTIIAGMVGVGNIMMIIVKERTKEIGIRKSLGATPWSIISMILQEALVISGLAGYAGLAVGCGVVAAIDYAVTNFGLESEFFYNPEINLRTAIAAILVLTLSGLVAGLIPGLRAAAVNPVEALRDE
ncbi:MAG: ABC transporter permease [Phaeodactylibacter sp.]|nr:ABC transporter permease [Phaeodactylibacter sp.]MCB9303130.1 ABC transporter permease [Lewinellaceae bacterium]